MDAQPGLLFEGAVHKVGGLMKKKWTRRWAAVKDVDQIGKVLEWKESRESSSIKHWIGFNLIDRVAFAEDDAVAANEVGRFKMVVTTRWREYDFAVDGKDVQGWFDVFDDKSVREPAKTDGVN